MSEHGNLESLSSVSFITLIKRLLNLRADTDTDGAVESIKSEVDFHSANAWTLVFAIFVASVGLNINSTAVVIGAMLISPLMGPIVGVGLALGINDFILLKRSAKNLAAAVGISIAASTIYFLLSPLSEVQSELLARTRPSFFDVLIAFFGGAAGIVAISRKEKGNAIPGVAIATALMPPLCTAGFGLATRNFNFFLGAMYLFVINSVFISISTFIFVRYLRFHKVTHVDSGQQKRINRWIALIGLIVLVPSFFMAWYLQRESFFRSQVNKYISQELRSDKSVIVDKEISFSIKDPKIKITLLGDPMSDSEIENLKQKAKRYSIAPSAIDIHVSTFSENIEKKFGDKISAAQDASEQLQVKLLKNEADLNEFKNLVTTSQRVTSELSIVFPKIESAWIVKDSSVNNLDSGSKALGPLDLKVLVQWKSAPSKSEINKATEFLSKRLNVGNNQVIHTRRL